MNDCIDCNVLPGHLRDICEGKDKLSEAQRQKYLEVWLRQSRIVLTQCTDTTTPRTLSSTKIDSTIRTVRLQNTGTGKPGTELKKSLAWIEKIKPEKATCACKNLASEMDAEGVVNCRLRRDGYYLPKMLENKTAIVTAMRAEGGLTGIVGLIGDAVPDAAMMFWMRRKFDAACEAAERPKPKQRHSRKMTVTAAERSLHAAAIANPPTEGDPFTATPVVHFAAHLWPKLGRWQWHVETWNRLADQINGRLIVCVATGADTDSADAVRAALDPRFEVHELLNTKEGENPSFRLIQTMIPSGQNDVLIYCHGKGMKAATFESPAVKIWSEAMYETVIFNQPKIIDRLAAGYRTFGSFRAFGDYPLKPLYRWHYAGTFFAIRAKFLNAAVVVPGYGGVEAWPGAWCPANLAWCEFADCRAIRSHYDATIMQTEVIPMLQTWRQNGSG